MPDELNPDEIYDIARKVVKLSDEGIRGFAKSFQASLQTGPDLEKAEEALRSLRKVIDKTLQCPPIEEILADAYLKNWKQVVGQNPSDHMRAALTDAIRDELKKYGIGMRNERRAK